MYNAHISAQIFEGNIRMRTVVGMMITYRGYNNPVWCAVRTVSTGAPYTWHIRYIYIYKRGEVTAVVATGSRGTEATL